MLHYFYNNKNEALYFNTPQTQKNQKPNKKQQQQQKQHKGSSCQYLLAIKTTGCPPKQKFPQILSLIKFNLT